VEAWKRWQDWTSFVLGLWLIASPFALGTSADQTSTWNAVVLGLIVLAIALWALAAPSSTATEYSNMIAGLWLIVSPYALGYVDLAFAARNAWVIGICVLALSTWALPSAMHARGQESGAGPVAGRRAS
jgi:hypothetical protein